MPIDTNIFDDDLLGDDQHPQPAEVSGHHVYDPHSAIPTSDQPAHDRSASDDLQKEPFTGWRQKVRSTNGVMAIAGGFLVAAVVVFFLTSTPKHKLASTPEPPSVEFTPPVPVLPQQNTPTNDVTAATPDPSSNQTTPAEILGTKTGSSQAGKSSTLSDSANHTIQVGDHASGESAYPSAALANVSSFPGESGHFQVPPPGSGNQAAEGGYVSTSGGAAPKPSLVFTRKGTELDKVYSAATFPQIHASNFGLPVGYKVAVRLESVASTALKAPVIAVVEYNVEKDGIIIIPAGAKFLGTITEADRNGTIGFQFTRLLQHDGTGTTVSAIAVDKNLAVLKGDVTGKNTGKQILVGIAQGLGSAGALVVGGGAGNLSSPYSESDAIRQQIAQNAGTTGDNAIQSLARTEHIIVTLPAGTEFYVEFVDTSKTNP